jgi:hypothetical protein
MRTLVHLPDVACFSFKFVSFDLFVGSAHAARHPPASAVSGAAGRREARYPCNRLHRYAQLPGRRCGFCALPASRSRIPQPPCTCDRAKFGTSFKRSSESSRTDERSVRSHHQILCKRMHMLLLNYALSMRTYRRKY